MPVRADFRELNNTLAPELRVLMVGEAEVFDAKFPVIYNTVFDDSIFEEWTSSSDAGTIQNSDAIRDTFKLHKVTHLMVNWFEILRYRMPGSYGYSEYVQPSRLEDLVQQGLLGTPRILMARSLSSFSNQDE